MFDFELVKTNYIKVRSTIIKYLENFDEESYYYQPTEKSNATAWIVPHLIAFEKIMVIDQITGYNFQFFITDENVEKYKPGVNGFEFKKNNLLKKEEAILLLLKAQEVSVDFLDELINNHAEVQTLDFQSIFNKYFLNYCHDTEHFGQIKYLIGTYNRMK